MEEENEIIIRPAFGDMRQAFSALTPDEEIGKLMQFRFQRGLYKGHPLGNIILAGCWDYAEKSLNTKDDKIIWDKTLDLVHKIWRIK